MLKRFRTAPIGAIILLLPVAAWADTGSPMDQVIGYLALFLATLITGLVTWALKKYFGITVNQQSKDTLEAAMQNGLALAISRYAPAGIASLEAKNKVVGDAMDYVASHAPDAAKALAIDPRQLAEKLEARLVQHSATAPISPATATPAIAN